MGGKRKKAGEAGEAARFISRGRAIKKLQLNLEDFNRLCIVKGVYPIEPKNRIRAQKGDSKFRPLYLKKDIKFLLHDPLVWTMRDEHALIRKLKKAKHKRDRTKQIIIKRNKPVYSLQQNVLERYPTFLDAVKDLSDALTRIFMFSTIYVRKPIREHHVSRCQRLRWEFLHYVIESQCLTKAFIASTCYYYECEILGQKVVWTVPHNCVTYVPPKVDMKILKNFLEFDMAMLGFVNYRLLGKVDLRYPLKPDGVLNFKKEEKKDLDNFKNLLVSLNYPLERTAEKVEVEEELDMNVIPEMSEEASKAYKAKLQAHERKKLFSGFKFFIGQENNRESLTLIIRNCGGEVSWPATVFPCTKYQEDDQSITHQIVDRPNFKKKYLSRYYVQPQWVYDCLNSATVKPCQQYYPEAELPPHICPFLKDQDGWYVPPEEDLMRKLLNSTPKEKEQIFMEMAEEERQKALALKTAEENQESSDDEENEDLEDQSNNEDAKEETEAMETSVTDMTEDNQEDSVPEKPKNIVRRGKEEHVNEKKEKEKEEKNELRMKAMSIHPANRRLYDKLVNKEARAERKSTTLKERREAIERVRSGKMSQKELDNWKPKKKKLTLLEKKKKSYDKRVKAAVKFAHSSKNVNRDKGSKK